LPSGAVGCGFLVVRNLRHHYHLTTTIITTIHMLLFRNKIFTILSYNIKNPRPFGRRTLAAEPMYHPAARWLPWVTS